VRLFVHHDKLHSCCGQREYPQRLLNFVASAPDVQLFSLADQLLTEVRVCHAASFMPP
jgi:hypothetical protein